MNPGSSTESYPAFARIGLRENPGKNLNQVTCPDRDSNPGHLVSRPDALTVTPQGIVLDPTIRFERDALQAQHVDEEKESIYESCIPYLSEKYNIPTSRPHKQVDPSLPPYPTPTPQTQPVSVGYSSKTPLGGIHWVRTRDPRAHIGSIVRSSRRRLTGLAVSGVRTGVESCPSQDNTHCHNPDDLRNYAVKLTGFLEFGKDAATLPPRGFDGHLSIFLNEGCDWLLTREDKISVIVRKTFIYDNQLVGGSRRKLGYDGRDWINLAQDRDRWRAYARAGSEPPGSLKAIYSMGSTEVGDPTRRSMYVAIH
ncbi:hypothetical protein ANN_07631 [Periplaneta americana]|uniref:Uncharacterized protein n=1 Tax=Periplaneta americana TaxID=6978 RepID=A0ABQ8T0R4_PERAM|nr:hypothetical protein ANN_07631 [Periplaneta americana]